MTLFSFHHNSNFPRLVPPALWRDPGHCAGSRRRKTERITHPGKTGAQCDCSFTCTHIHWFLPSEKKKKKRVWYSRCERGRRFLLCAHGISVSGSWLGDTILNVMRSVFRHNSVSLFTCGPQRPLIHLLTMDDEGQALAKSPQLLPPFPLFCL